MQTPPGEELNCQAGNAPFPHDDRLVERGIISYFAARALPTALTAQDWLLSIDRATARAGRRGELRPWQQPRLQGIGNLSRPLPGTPVDSTP